jgi:hypothetical protein
MSNVGPPRTATGKRSAKVATTPSLSSLRIIKKLPTNSRGSKGLSAQYGDRLVCIRHRIDPTGTKRLTTVELVVSESVIQRKARPLVDVVIKRHEEDLQARIKAAGGRWDRAEGVWRIRRATAVALGLRKRILP